MAAARASLSLCGEYVVYVSKREYVHVYVCDLCRLTSLVGRVVLRPSHMTALNATRFCRREHVTRVS